MKDLTHEDTKSEIERIEHVVRQIEIEEFPEDVVNMAQEELAEVKAAYGKLMQYGAESIPMLANQEVGVYRAYQKKARKALVLLESLL